MKKVSIIDSQESFAIMGKSSEELETKLNLLKFQSISIQPLLLVLGDLEDIKNISIYFDGIRYSMMTSLTALDILYKMMFVFNLEFPKQ